jgi:hypothetical protein
MPDGCSRELNGEAVFAFRGSLTPAFLQDVQQDLAHAWRLMLASESGQALMVVEAGGPPLYSGVARQSR